MDTWIRQEDGSVVTKQPRYPRFLKYFQRQPYCDHMKPQEKHFIKTGKNKPSLNPATLFLHYHEKAQALLGTWVPSLEAIDEFWGFGGRGEEAQSSMGSVFSLF